MDYFTILNLQREPFGNSPAPDFFYLSAEHLACLQQLELSIRLRRGLSVVMGDVGTGKTTLCRQLIRKFTESPEDGREFQTHLILDPSFENSREFLSAVGATFGLSAARTGESEWQLREAIKKHLFHKGVDEAVTVVLIIDEAQKLPHFCREILREFLNYETNENKLLQIILFAQNEFGEALKGHTNFADRVNRVHQLKPLNFKETKALIRFRLARAGRSRQMPPLFTLPALWAVYRSTGGYPRRIVTLCHQVLLTLIVQNRVKAGWTTVRATAGRAMPLLVRKRRWTAAVLFSLPALALIAALLFLPQPPRISHPLAGQSVSVPDGEAMLAPAPAAAEPGAPTAPPAGQPPGVAKAPEPPATPDVRPSAFKAPSPAAPEPAAEPMPAVPALLGKLRIHEGSSVLLLLLQIYGNTETNRFQAVGRANPHIKDLNRVREGETIVFPAIPAKAASLEGAGHWVQLARTASLEEAYRIIRRYPDDQSSLRLIPQWNGKEGLVFPVILRKGYKEREEALRALHGLPAEFAAGAELMSKPDKDTVYFAY